MQKSSMKPVQKFSNQKIYMDNRFLKSDMILTFEEQKTAYAIFSLIKPFEVNENKFFISKKAFLEKVNVNSKYGYELYGKVISNFAGKLNIKIHTPEVKGSVTLITSSLWYPKKNYFEITINPEIMVFLENLNNKHFGIVDFVEINSLISEYSRILYRQIIPLLNLKDKTTYYNTEQLRQLFLLQEADYVYEGKFHRSLFENKTIKKAISELNEKTKLIVGYEKIKKNQIVVYKIFFDIKPNKNENDKFIIENKDLKHVTNIDSFIYEDKNEMKKDIKNIPLTKDINIGIEETIFEKINKDSYFRDLNLQEQEIITHKEILEKILPINELCGNKEKCLYFGCHYKMVRDELNNLFLKKYECKKIKDFKNMDDEIVNKQIQNKLKIICNSNEYKFNNQ